MGSMNQPNGMNPQNNMNRGPGGMNQNNQMGGMNPNNQMGGPGGPPQNGSNNNMGDPYQNQYGERANRREYNSDPSKGGF